MSDPQIPDPADSGTWSERNYRSLKIAVIVMGVLIVAGLVLVVVTIATRISGAGSDRDSAPIATVLPEDVASLLGPESQVVSTAIDGNRLAIVVRRAAGHAIVVVDLRSGRVVNVVGAE